MQNNYLNIHFTSYAKKSDIPTVTDNILIITATDQTKQYALKKALTETIHESFLKSKTEVINFLGDHKNFLVITPNRDLEALRSAGASLYYSIQRLNIHAAKLRGLHQLTETERYAFLEGLLLSSYDFDKYQTDKTKSPTTIYIPQQSFSTNKLLELNILAEAISWAKSLVNEPVNYLDSLRFSLLCKEAGKHFGFQTEILHKSQIEKLKMGGLLAVNKGSETPPTFNIFHYKPDNAINKKPLVLVGKGIMYDTGGYSLKINGNMLSMKCDMAGGAAVLGTIAAISGNKLPYHIIGLVPATDNKISSNALVADDIIKMMNGTTVEVQNTDAEGRLVLADALTYAARFAPELVIDIATLTGASAAITGPYGLAVSGNDQKTINELKDHGDQVYERLLQFPLWPEYKTLLKSNIADLSNIGGPVGGVSTSSLFLEHFTDYPWVHLDIAGAAFIKKRTSYRQKGPTAVPIRLLYQYIKTKTDLQGL
ncbi:leucyl aminopeptidase [Sphingobacterium sp. UT-1RO-CII-1]|uniref:leucyl aminopeptidase family protein n=1 Tax=Sphingobacterium sp. UT-1RO-CII-1 TaxID=2995225 RepID=UPI00227C2D94|nr:leucyl aminopeptidase [Sphingobacterium sp. UT-1RO-CII-1]MCY4781227.1 leucyl aminopeptidase [Sphingobacterium sp. UT-1RO-CII-1]